MADRNFFEQKYRSIWDSSGWQDFRSFRESWDALIRRRLPQVLNPIAANYLAAINASVDIQSPDLEEDLHDRVSVLLSNTARIDAISLDQSKRAKDAVEDIRIWSAGRWLQDNETRRITRALYEQMCRYGVAVAQKLYQMPGEPEAGEEREDYYTEHLRDVFGWRYVSPMEIAWFPLVEPEVFIQESEVPYVEARELRRGKEKLRINKDNKLVFWGDSEPFEETSSSWETKRVRLTRIAWLDKELGRWRWADWVRGDTSPVGEAELIEEDVCPFKHAPYFIAAGGDELMTETDPHLRYRPMIYPLIVDVQELNALVTLLVMTLVWHLQNPFYVRLDRVRPELLPHLEGLADAGLGFMEGAGAERKFVFRVPDPGSGEVMAAPALEAMPNAELPEAFIARLQQVQLNIQSHRSNRYLTGEAFGETEKQPATSTLNQVEAAATPFGPYLTNGDWFIKEWLLAEHEAIIYWDEDAPKKAQKPYPMRVRGDEPALKTRESGEEITITAEKLRNPYVLTVTTRNETQAEAAMNQQLADVAYEKGAITKEQWLRQRGAIDPQKQADDLWRDQMEAMTEAEFAPLLMQNYRTLFAALTGLNAALLQPQVPMSPAPAPAPPTGGAPTPPQRFGIQNGTAAAVQGAQGGTTPVGAAGNGGAPV